MVRGLDIIIVDDDPIVCKSLSMAIKTFYTWGEIHAFTDVDEAREFCLNQEMRVAIFVLDVFMGKQTGFSFLDAVAHKFQMAYEDAIIITGQDSDDVVNMCLASDVNYLLEKPLKPYALQLAVRSITAKYLEFAKKLLQDQRFAENVARL